MDQFNTLVQLLPQIETALSERGEKVERPSYDGLSASAANDDGDDEEGEEKLGKGKRNFDETSEDD